MLHRFPRNYIQSTDGVNNETHHFENDLHIHCGSLQDLAEDEHRSIETQTESIQKTNSEQYTHNSTNAQRDAYTIQKMALHPYCDGGVNEPVDKEDQSGESDGRNKSGHFAKRERIQVPEEST